MGTDCKESVCDLPNAPVKCLMPRVVRQRTSHEARPPREERQKTEGRRQRAESTRTIRRADDLHDELRTQVTQLEQRARDERRHELRVGQRAGHPQRTYADTHRELQRISAVHARPPAEPNARLRTWLPRITIYTINTIKLTCKT